MPEQNAIDVRGAYRIFGSGGKAIFAVDDLSVSVKQNEFFTLPGPSGCGKTTLLRLIAGFEFPTSGESVLPGENIAAKRPVNAVFQSCALFQHMSVAENIGFGLKMFRYPKAEVKARLNAMRTLPTPRKSISRRVRPCLNMCNPARRKRSRSTMRFGQACGNCSCSRTPGGD